MNIEEILKDLLYILITVLIPVLLPKVLSFINVKVDELQKNAEIADNKILNTYIDNVQSAITIAVTTVTQTYVESLKASGKFTQEAQKEAKDKALKLAKSLITEDAIQAITIVYGDFDTYLDATIEKIVNELKK